MNPMSTDRGKRRLRPWCGRDRMRRSPTSVFRQARSRVPGAAGQPHARIKGSHFVQEDCGSELAERILQWRT